MGRVRKSDVEEPEVKSKKSKTEDYESPTRSQRSRESKSYVSNNESDVEEPETTKENNKKKTKTTSKTVESKKSKNKKKESDSEDEEEDDAEEIYEVEKVVGVRKTKKGKTEYLIHWKGWSSSDDTWELEEGLNCDDLIKEFNQNQADKKKTAEKSKQVKIEESEDEDDQPLIKKIASKSKMLKKEESEDEDDEPLAKKSKKAPLKTSSVKKGAPENGEKHSKSKAEEKKALKSDEKIGEKEASESGESSRSEEAYEVERIIQVRLKRNGNKEFLVRWKGWSKNDDTWEPEEHLDCNELIAEFMKQNETETETHGRSLRVNPQKAPTKQVAQESTRSSHRTKNKRTTYFED